MVCTNAECGYRAPKKFWNPDKMAESGGKFICPKCGAEMKEGEAAAAETPAAEEPPAKHGRAGIWLTADQLEQICPDCAKAMRDRNLKEINVEALEPDVLRKFLAAKAGRVLSAANVQKLKDCLDDLEELAGMDLPRAAGALAGRIVQTLGALVEAATPAGNEMETEKAAEPVTLAAMIAGASRYELIKVSKTVQAILDVDAIDAAGAQYRELVKC
jgi:hypothetical protein